MSRSFGEIDAVQSVLPEWLALPIALATQVGAIWFATCVLVAYYVLVDREEAITFGGLLLASIGAWRAVKEVLQVYRPREFLVPPDAYDGVVGTIYDAAVVHGGHGLPSGHAVTTTLIYLLLAEHLEVSSRRRRYACAFGVIAFVGWTRIALGVHYVADVVAGIAIALGLLTLAWAAFASLPYERPTIAAALAISVATINVVVDWPYYKEVIVLLAAIGLAGWWVLVVRPGRHPFTTTARLRRSQP